MSVKILILVLLAVGTVLLVGLGISSAPGPVQSPISSPRPTVVYSPEPEPEISPLPTAAQSSMPTPLQSPPRATPTPGTVTASAGTPFRLGFGQSARITGTDMMLTFVTVLDDSRCPADATCVWEGQVTVDISVAASGEDLGVRTLTSRAGHDDLAVKHAAGYEIRLLGVTPARTSAAEIPMHEYALKLQVKESSPVP